MESKYFFQLVGLQEINKNCCHFYFVTPVLGTRNGHVQSSVEVETVSLPTKHNIVRTYHLSLNHKKMLY